MCEIKTIHASRPLGWFKSEALYKQDIVQSVIRGRYDCSESTHVESEVSTEVRVSLQPCRGILGEESCWEGRSLYATME